jgi:hypothetical protein
VSRALALVALVACGAPAPAPVDGALPTCDSLGAPAVLACDARGVCTYDGQRCTRVAPEDAGP